MTDDQASTSKPIKTTFTKRWRQGVKRFKTVEDLVDTIGNYLAELDTENTARKNKQAPLRPSFADLAAFCGIAKTTLSTYDGELREVLDRFKTLCEAALERHLIDKRFSTAGIIFALKNNHGWQDTTRQEFTGAGGGAIIAEVRYVEADPQLKAEADQWDDPDFHPSDDTAADEPSDT